MKCAIEPCPLTCLIVHHPGTLSARKFDELEEVHHSLSLQPLQLCMDANEGPSTTNPITEGERKQFHHSGVVPTISEINEVTDLHMTVMGLFPVFICTLVT